ncbi:MAG: Swt1 family HEPN domain-containing protein [Candidatus Bathyarchaeia archaeon]|jgi:hypothetical protein
MINQEVLKLLKAKIGLSVPGLYATIDRKKKQIGYAYSTETAAYILASENGIDISKHLTGQELAEVREAMRSTQPLVQMSRAPIEITKRPVVRLDNEVKINCPNVPDSVLKDAKKMASVYPYLYVFENSIRYFIIESLSKYGKDWWVSKVNVKIQQKAKDRQSKEGRNRWHGTRGEHPIFYVDIDDLQKIITSNYEDFQDKLPDVDRPIEWLTNRIEEVELSRNIIAHHNPLSDDDIDRVKMYFKDWIKQFASDR